MMEAFNDTWNYLDEFSGYGGFHLGLEKAGFKFGKCFYSEINKYAIANYAHNFKNSEYVGSITDVSRRTIAERIDLITFGWPCQDNSIAGKRKGQSSGTRSGLLYEATRTVNEFKPWLFLAENVEGLRTVNKGIDIVESFRVLSFLNESLPQYDIEMQLFNSCWFLPQNRERLYFVGHLRSGGGSKVFPIGEVGELSGEARCETGRAPVQTRVIARCLTVSAGKQNLETNYVFVPGKGVRRYTPIEYERLQGLPDNWTKYGVFDGKEKEISDTQRYNLTGNGVSIPVVEAIGKKYLSLNNHLQMP